jgi:hypothetical protein
MIDDPVSDEAALRALHAERFAALPFDCGQELQPGVADVDEWRDWSAMPTTPDQLRIEDYIDRFALAGKALLHVGSGNSLLARRFARRAAKIVGTTVVPAEVRCGEAMGIGNYRVLLHNKYRGGDGMAGDRFDFIVDNNPATFCCCLTHLSRMLGFYGQSLAEGGQIVTDRVGLGWTMEGAHSRWSLDFDDLAAVARLAGLDAHDVGGGTIVLARGAPPKPGPIALGQRVLRRGARALRRAFVRRRTA